MHKLLVALAIVTTLIAAVVFLGNASDAQETTCPDGSTLSADGTACVTDSSDSDGDGVNDNGVNDNGVKDNVVTTTSCLQGVLSDDGQFCIVPRTDAAPAATGTTLDAPVPAFTG